MAKGIALLALALLGLPIYGQQAGPLTDQRVIDLARAGVRPDELARIIADAPQVSFDLTPAWSQAMMTAGVTEDTIKAMAAREAGTAPSTAATQQSQGAEVLDKKPASEVAARGGPPQPTVSKLKDQSRLLHAPTSRWSPETN